MGSMRTHQLPTFVRGDARLNLGIIAKQKTLDSNWKQTAGDDSRTYGRSKGECEAETLRILGEEFMHSPKRRSCRKNMAGLAAGLQSTNKNILGDLDRLRGRFRI